MIFKLPDRYKDRFDAARQLLEPLKEFLARTDVILLAIPRGALQIGNFLARELRLPLDVVIVKKLPAPASEELAMGAVALDGGEVLDEEMVREFGVSDAYLVAERERLQKLMKEKDSAYHAAVPRIDLRSKVVVILDDGIATGQTMRAAVEYARRQGAAKVVVVSPATSQEAFDMLKKIADEVISLKTEQIFFAVGTYYVNFPQIEDDEAIQLLKEANKKEAA